MPVFVFSPARLHLGIALFFQGCAVILAQNYSGQVEYDFRRIGIQDGIASQIITSVREDTKGLLWFGTQNGLYYFDGFRVTHFLPSPTERLPSELITDLELITTPETDYLLVCTQSGSRLVHAVRRCLVSFEAIGLADKDWGQCAQIEKKEPGKYIVLCGNKLHLFEQTKNNKFSARLLSDLPLLQSPKVVLDPNDSASVWLFPSQQQAYRLNNGKLTHYSIPVVRDNLSPIQGLLGLTRSPLGTVGWDHARNLYRYNPLSDHFELITTGLTLVSIFPALEALDQKFKQRNILHTHVLLETGQEAIGTTLGLFICQKRTNPFRVPVSMIGSEIRGIWTDTLGNWVAGTYTGMFRSSFQHDTVIRMAPLKGVWSFLHLSNDVSILASEDAQGLYRWDQRTNTVSAVDLSSTAPQDRPRSALSLCRDAMGNIWVGTYHNLFWSRPDSPFVFRAFFHSEQPHTFQRIYFRTLFPDRDSSIWVGCEKGLLRIDLRNHPDHVRIDTMLPQVFVSDIYPDRHGNVWIATKGNGVTRYDRTTKRFEWFGTNRGLSNNYTCRIEGSNDDKVLWISTHDGLSQLDVQSGIFHNYREENGMPGNEFNSGASTKSSNGTLLFGGVSGLVYFHPDSLQPHNFRYKTTLSHLHYHDKDTDSLITLNIHDESIILPPYPRTVEICLGVNDYIRSSQTRFRYRLLNTSNDWIFTNGENKIRLFQLAPGDYIFEAQAFPHNGHQSPIVRFHIQIQLPYYETWWFCALLVFSIAFISYLAYWSQLRRLRRTHAIRQQIADDLHDDIGNKLNIIGILIQKIKISRQESLPSDEILNKVLEINRDTLLSLRTLIWSADPKKDHLHNLFVRMQDFADDYLQPLNIRCHFSLPSPIPKGEIRIDVRHNLIMIYQELLTNMIKHASPKEINISVSLDTNNNLTLILTNTFHLLEQENFNTFSGNLGLDILQRRLDKVGATIRSVETNDTFQKIALSFPHIFN